MSQALEAPALNVEFEIPKGFQKLSLFALHSDPPPPFMSVDFRPFRKCCHTPPSCWGQVYALPFTLVQADEIFKNWQSTTTSDGPGIDTTTTTGNGLQPGLPLGNFDIVEKLGHMRVLIVMQVMDVLNKNLIYGYSWSLVGNYLDKDACRNPYCKHTFKVMLKRNTAPNFALSYLRITPGMHCHIIFVPAQHRAPSKDKNVGGSTDEGLQSTSGPSGAGVTQGVGIDENTSTRSQNGKGGASSGVSGANASNRLVMANGNATVSLITPRHMPISTSHPADVQLKPTDNGKEPMAKRQKTVAPVPKI